MAYTDQYNRNGSVMGDALYGVKSKLAPSFRPGGGSVTPTQAPLSAAPAQGNPLASQGQATGLIPENPVGATPPSGGVPDYQNPNDNLAMWGYTGEIPINNIEQQAIDFVNNLYGTQGPLSTMGGAQDYYQKVLAGDYGPEGQAYLQSVLDPMRASETQNYNDKAKALATKFSQYGGYFGGKHGVAQGRLASESANNMAQNEANLRYQGFTDNMNRMGGAAQGLQSLGQAQSGVSGDMLNYLLSTGGMVTGRDALNRSEYQAALQRSYNDWLRARQEQLMPFSMASSLIGQQATQPIVTQTQSPWGAALGALGTIGGAAMGNYQNIF